MQWFDELKNELKKKLKKLPLGDKKITPNKDSRDSLAKKYEEWLRDFLELPPVVPVMTYEEAVRYFVTARPPDPKIEKGAILRQSHSQGDLLTQVFLDKNNDLVRDPDGKPYGRQLVAEKIDEELHNTLGDTNLIIVK